MKGPHGSAGRVLGRTEVRPTIGPISSGAALTHRVPLAVAGAAVNAEQRRTTPLDAQPRMLMNTTLGAGPGATA